MLIDARRGAVLGTAHLVLSHAARDLLFGEDRRVDVPKTMERVVLWDAGFGVAGATRVDIGGPAGSLVPVGPNQMRDAQSRTSVGNLNLIVERGTRLDPRPR